MPFGVFYLYLCILLFLMKPWHKLSIQVELFFYTLCLFTNILCSMYLLWNTFLMFWPMLSLNSLGSLNDIDLIVSCLNFLISGTIGMFYYAYNPDSLAFYLFMFELCLNFYLHKNIIFHITKLYQLSLAQIGQLFGSFLFCCCCELDDFQLLHYKRFIYFYVMVVRM